MGIASDTDSKPFNDENNTCNHKYLKGKYNMEFSTEETESDTEVNTGGKYRERVQVGIRRMEKTRGQRCNG